MESILGQTFTDFEFIIVNDGSADSSLDIIQSYKDERIPFVDTEQNIGLTKSLNKALESAKKNERNQKRRVYKSLGILLTV